MSLDEDCILHTESGVRITLVEERSGFLEGVFVGMAFLLGGFTVERPLTLRRDVVKAAISSPLPRNGRSRPFHTMNKRTSHAQLGSIYCRLRSYNRSLRCSTRFLLTPQHHVLHSCRRDTGRCGTPMRAGC